jgi:hypothetical protein
MRTGSILRSQLFWDWSVDNSPFSNISANTSFLGFLEHPIHHTLRAYCHRDIAQKLGIDNWAGTLSDWHDVFSDNLFTHINETFEYVNGCSLNEHDTTLKVEFPSLSNESWDHWSSFKALSGGISCLRKLKSELFDSSDQLVPLRLFQTSLASMIITRAGETFIKKLEKRINSLRKSPSTTSSREGMHPVLCLFGAVELVEETLNLHPTHYPNVGYNFPCTFRLVRLTHEQNPLWPSTDKVMRECAEHLVSAFRVYFDVIGERVSKDNGRG